MGIKLISAKVTQEDFKHIQALVRTLQQHPENKEMGLKEYVRFCVVQTTNTILADLKKQREAAQVTPADSPEAEIVAESSQEKVPDV